MAKKRKLPLIEGLFSLDGRMRRSEYWLVSIGLTVVKVPLTLLGHFLGPDGAAIVRVLLELLFLWPALALMVKRGHDRNRPAIFVIGLQAVLFVVAIVFYAVPDGGLKYAATAVLAVIALYAFIEFGCLDGTQGPNRYGRSPKGIGGDPDSQLAEVFA
ncbi:DUF805 domain-containing protein [Caulobacter sp. DWP3-1-3b2]|uniref:DUF805 domain-containing protein n=1 Tax=Caulobacter sp. DWP3-1-3b2 TaxID=2804643 RepID=UPI003CE6F951